MRSGPTDHDPLTGSPDRTHDATAIASSDGVTVSLHDLGGSGPLLLLAHATGFHGLVWGPCASHLPERHCVAPDLRGHGDSVVPDGIGFAWSGFADDVLAVVDHLGGGPIIAAGHSKGGAALLLAEERRPGTFEALYLYEPIVFPAADLAIERAEGGPPNPLAAGARRRRPTFESYDAAYDNYASKPPLDAFDPAVLRAYVDGGFRPDPDGSVTLKCRPEVEAQVFEMGPRHDAYDHLGEVRCPVTVGFGVEEPFSPATFARPIVAALPDGHLDPHPDLGHFGPLADPAAIAASIRAALIDR